MGPSKEPYKIQHSIIKAAEIFSQLVGVSIGPIDVCTDAGMEMWSVLRSGKKSTNIFRSSFHLKTPLIIYSERNSFPWVPTIMAHKESHSLMGMG